MVTKPDPSSRFARRSDRALRSMSETLAPAVADEPTRQLTARIPESLHKQVRQHVADRDISVQDFVRAAVIEALNQKPTG